VIVPNFIPDPLEVPGNVTEQPFLLRVRFIRTVSVLFAACTLAIGALVSAPLPTIGIFPSLAALVILLISLELWRIAFRGRAIEGKVSAAVLPLVLVCAALVVNEIRQFDLPVWQGLTGPICLAIYSLACGRDYSFIGGLLLSLIASIVVIAGVGVSSGATVPRELFAQGSNAVLTIYLSYDMASLLSRRRRGEEVAAVTDIYRDVFNFFGYVVRVIKHWQRHRIWSKS
jgi:FtsH-binding integral membrane protein